MSTTGKSSVREEPIGYVIKRIQISLRTQIDDALRPIELTAPQYAALATLAEEPGASNAELARRSFVTPQTMFRIVDNLVEAGLISRRPSRANARVLEARLTSRGGRLLAEAHGPVYAVEDRMLRPLDAGERRALRRLLGRCAEALDTEECPSDPAG
jgi:DNA-binding MarR family transcriptional regulator